MEKEVLLSVDKGIALITLNRPERRNSINQNLLIGLFNALEEVSDNKEIKVAIITGSGKSFCSGVDLAIAGKENLADPRGDGMHFVDIFSSCKKPVIGAINGHTITGGFEIALNCDFLIASENAMFADSHGRVGIHPGWGMTQMLQQVVGQRMAMQMSMTCQFVDAQTALRIGLVNEVVPHDNLIPRVMEIAQFICDGKSDMLMRVKELIKYRNNSTYEGALLNERKRFFEYYKHNAV